jgi:hypothetical protein
MKRITLALSIVAIALPLGAQTVATTTAPAAQDSPLVAAAKASKKANGGKSIVITNDTLVKTGGGHLTQANVSPNAALPPGLPPAAASANVTMKGKAEADAKAKKEAAKKELQTKAIAADLYGESIEERVNDPALQEHLMNQATSTQAKTTTNTSQPQTVPTNPKPPEN